jgi:antitoxin (DNA-binding transcriptional repressor) of toxin-antitoxin stability system
MCQNMTMFKVNIHEAKARLSEYVEAVERGEHVVICRRNRPVAELRAVVAGRTTPRPVGDAAAAFEVPASFFDPLPDEIVEAFYDAHGGESSETPRQQRATAVAERAPAYRPGRSARKRPPRS